MFAGRWILKGILISILPILPACSQPSESVRCVTETAVWSDKPGVPFLYDLKHPDQTIVLPEILQEVSGLTLSEDGSQLIAIQDEQGILFFISLEQPDSLKAVSFGNDGDYEGVEVVPGGIFVVKSNGSLQYLEEEGGVYRQQQSFKTFLDTENNVEGLAFDPVRNQLLVACKGNPGIHPETANKKSIYGFDLNTRKLDTVPVLCITGESIYKTYEQLQGKYQEAHKIEHLFNPSGIAVHPLTGTWYILSASKRILLCVDPGNGSILHLERLSEKLFEQPEGICFDHSGRLYIASEGRKQKPVIHAFDMQE